MHLLVPPIDASTSGCRIAIVLLHCRLSTIIDVSCWNRIVERYRWTRDYRYRLFATFVPENHPWKRLCQDCVDYDQNQYDRFVSMRRMCDVETTVRHRNTTKAKKMAVWIGYRIVVVDDLT